MVKYRPEALDATFAALADPTRRAILTRLAHGEASVSELAEPFDVSLPAISKHLRVLERAGLLAGEREGRLYRCRLVGRPLRDAAEWLARYRRFWEGQLDALARYLAKSEKTEEPGWRTRTLVPKRRSASREPLRRRGRRSSGPGRIPKR